MQERSFEDLADDFPVIFLDAFGVLLDASGLMGPSPEVIERLLAAGKDLYVVTNDASRSPEILAQYYINSEGRPTIAADRIISSGILAGEVLAEHVDAGKVGYLGTPAAAEYIRRVGLEPVPIAECDEDSEIAGIALLDDDGFDWREGINRTLAILRQRPVPTVVANGDLGYPVGDGRVEAAIGSIAQVLEGILDTRFIRCSKPDSVMFSRAFEKASQDHPGLLTSDVLMVGDTLQTDIRGGRDFGLKTALVCSGHTQRSRVPELIQRLDITPDFLCESIFT